MKRFIQAAALICLPTFASFSAAGPVNGPIGRKHKLEAGERLVFAMEFKGGERACVIVNGDHDPPANLTITVFEAKKDPSANKVRPGNAVAKDNLGGDVCSVIWYPPRTAPYIIEISSSGGVWNMLWLAVR